MSSNLASTEELEQATDLLCRGLRRMSIFGVPCLINTALIIPFLSEHSLHKHFYSIGRPLLVTATGLWILFVMSAAQVYFFWIDVRQLRKLQTERGCKEN